MFIEIRFMLIAVAFLILGIQPIFADSLNQLAQCQLVPAASFNDDENTAVGLISDSGGSIRWHFYGTDAQRLDSGQFAIEENSFAGFSANAELQSDLSGVQGYLLFCLDDNNDSRIDFEDDPDLAANAFLIKSVARDVIYIPTVPVFAANLIADDRDNDVDDWTDDPINILEDGAREDDKLLMRYFTDGASGGDNTQIYIYTTRRTDSSETMEVVGPDMTADISIPLTRDNHLNVIDPETIDDLNVSGLIGSGFLAWRLPEDVRSAFVFSLAESDAFGATQTLVGGIDTEPDN